MFRDWAPYVSVAERRRRAAQEMARQARRGVAASPVLITGRAIATTPWGRAWCANLEGYSDYVNRLPRGRTYVRNGSVVDLQVDGGVVRAQVSGSSLYRTTITVARLPAPRWKTLCGDCAGGIDSLVELLAGRFAAGVMARLCRQGDGLFPTPGELTFSCSCPDGARMCKHVAAVLYGIGSRLDHAPELLFTLRGVAGQELIAQAGSALASAAPAVGERTLVEDDLGGLFGVDLASSAAPAAPPPTLPIASPPEATPATSTPRRAAVPPVPPVRDPPPPVVGDLAAKRQTVAGQRAKVMGKAKGAKRGQGRSSIF